MWNRAPESSPSSVVRWTALAVLVAFAFVVAWGTGADATEAGDGSRCPTKERPDLAPAEMRDRMRSVAAQPRGLVSHDPIQIDFGTGRGWNDEERFVSLSGVGLGDLPEGLTLDSGTPVWVKHSDFHRADRLRALNHTQIDVAGWWDANDEHIVVWVCVDAGHQSVDPGRYTGTVTINDPRFGEWDLQLIVTMKTAAGAQTFVVMLAGGVGGGVWGVVSSLGAGLQASRRENEPSPLQAAVDADRRFYLLLLAFAGAAGAVVGVEAWSRVYDSDPAYTISGWGGWFELFYQAAAPGAATFAFVWVLTTVANGAISLIRRPKSSTPAAPAPGAS